MNARELASEIAKREGGKTEVRIGDIRSILGIIADLTHEDSNNLMVLFQLAKSRKAKGRSTSPKKK